MASVESRVVIRATLHDRPITAPTRGTLCLAGATTRRRRSLAAPLRGERVATEARDREPIGCLALPGRFTLVPLRPTPWHGFIPRCRRAGEHELWRFTAAYYGDEPFAPSPRWFCLGGTISKSARRRRPSQPLNVNRNLNPSVERENPSVERE